MSASKTAAKKPAKKKMTQREAWLFIAKQLKVVEPENIGGLWIELLGDLTSGLCGCVRILNCRELISDSVAEMMLKKIDHPRVKWVDGYWRWPRDAAGMNKRIAFCRRQAAPPARKKKAAA